MSSIQKHRQHFAQTPQVNIQRSTFDRSMGTKTTFDAGWIIPLKVLEIIPGDTIELNTRAFIRMLTPLTPFMDNVYFDMFAFFDPNRLVWDNWQPFMGERKTPDDETDYTIPTTSPVVLQVQTLWDHYGVPFSEGTEAIPLNALIFRQYNHIYNEWFRDENLIDPVQVPLDNGPDLPSIYNLQRRGKRHDYFTSALPWPQKGPDVLIPMSDSAVVIGDGTQFKLSDTNNPAGTARGVTARIIGGTNNVAFVTGASMPDTTQLYASTNPNGSVGLEALTAEIGGTINQLRQAEAIQVLFERDARGGTRYIEMLKSQYGVTNPDFRLQRPELLGQGQLILNTNPVPQTSATEETSPQGNLAAVSVASGNGALRFTHSFTEHGYVHIFISARADLNYQQGLEKIWSRRKRFDFYIPALANLGEQPVLGKEIYWSDPLINPTWNESVFGYQERWSEYRYGYNNITGKFRTAYGDAGLSQWHLAQYFETPPALNQAFIEENPPMERVLAIEPTGDTFFGDFWFDIKHTRPMPVYSIPGWSKNL